MAADNDGGMFTCFNLLPVELRLKIWEEAHAGVEPRIIHITHRSEKLHHSDGNCYNVDYETKTSSEHEYPVPSLLHVNRESRELVGKGYRQVMDSTGVFIDFSKDALAFTCFNGLADGRWMGGEGLSKPLETFTSRDARTKLRHIVLNDQDCGMLDEEIECCKGFRGLKSITIRIVAGMKDEMLDEIKEQEEKWGENRQMVISLVSWNDMKRLVDGDASVLLTKIAAIKSGVTMGFEYKRVFGDNLEEDNNSKENDGNEEDNTEEDSTDEDDSEEYDTGEEQED